MDNVIDKTTAGAASGGFNNDPAFPNNNATTPQGQGDSHPWAGVPVPGDDSQHAVVAGDADGPEGSALVEQEFRKPA